MLAAVMMDVEDLITEESDDACLWISRAFSARELTATFFVVGEKARLWEERGRTDLIEAVRRHDVGFHSTWHSIHPTMAELCQNRDFLGGMEEIWSREQRGWFDVERIFRKPLSGWGTTGTSWTPSLSGLMGRMGRGYMYSPIRLSGHSACWFAGSLQFDSHIAGFDDTFADDNLFKSKLKETRSFLSNQQKNGSDLACIFLGHPTKLICMEFWDAINLAHGKNLERYRWQQPRLKPRETWSTIQRNFGHLLDLLASQKDIQIVGLRELTQAFGAQKPFLSHKELMDISTRIAQEETVLFTDHFTSAEILLSLCRAVLDPRDKYPRESCWGPNALPIHSSKTDFLPEDILTMTQEIQEAVHSTGALPAQVELERNEVGIGTCFVALAKALTGATSLSAPVHLPYPPQAETVADTVAKKVPGWIIHPPDLKMHTLLLHTKLQCWSLKSAGLG